MAASSSLTSGEQFAPWIAAILLAIGSVARLWIAARTFLNPDEALHYFVAAQPTLRQTYEVSLTTAHPPLMFFLLHGWTKLGSSEFFLRLPFVIAGALFCWILFRWVQRIAGSNVALLALVMCLFSPVLISLSAEVRQYSLLLLFCAGSLYALERGWQEDSSRWIWFSSITLWLALLTHYSALLFAAAWGIYGWMLVWSCPRRAKSAWVTGQIIALSICIALFKTQVLKLRNARVPSEIAATWLSKSIYHSGSDHLGTFMVTRTSRLFRYFFSHGTIGVVMLLFFLAGLLAMFAGKPERLKSPRALAVLCATPFILAIATAIAGIYPYGGTRHDVVLAVSAIPAIAIGIDLITARAIGPSRRLAAVLVLLIVANIFASPTPPFIRPGNQQQPLMKQAIAQLNSQPTGSAILADYQGALVLGYYLCGRQTSLPFGPTPKDLLVAPCAEKTLLTSVGSQSSFAAEELPQVIRQAWNMLPVQRSEIWLFETGWISDEPGKWRTELHRVACDEIHDFGENLRVSRCRR